MALKFTTSYLEDSLELFRYYKKLGECAIEQVDDSQLCTALDGEMNSIAVIVKHMAGNMRSRWSDFLTTDGEKPDRNRDSEFVEPPASRAALIQMWDEGWAFVFGALEPLADGDLGRVVTIRGEAHSVMQAIHRQVAHYAHHVGQIVMLAKHLAHARWQSLSVPRNRSEEFNRRETPARGKGGAAGLNAAPASPARAPAGMGQQDDPAVDWLERTSFWWGGAGNA